MQNYIVLAQIFSCFFMTGLIWLIQLVHYPSFRKIDHEKFIEFQKFHSNTITFIVGPMMLIEVGTGLYIFLRQELTPLNIFNFMALFLIWLATAFLSVPTHNKLSQGYNIKTINFLIKTNWLRTLLWTFRSLLILNALLKLNLVDPFFS
jgi:hypothetical protein